MKWPPHRFVADGVASDRPSEGQEPNLEARKPFADLSDLLLAPDQRSWLEGEVVPVGIEGPKRGELRRQFRSEELEDPLWPEEVLETMLAEVP